MNTYVPEVDCCLRTLGIVIKMNDIPEFIDSDVSKMTAVEKAINKLIPQSRVFRQIIAF